MFEVGYINKLVVWTVCNFILASCEAYLILIYILQKDAVVAALPELKKVYRDISIVLLMSAKVFRLTLRGI